MLKEGLYIRPAPSEFDEIESYFLKKNNAVGISRLVFLDEHNSVHVRKNQHEFQMSAVQAQGKELRSPSQL
jgi:hypothetical protein